MPFKTETKHFLKLTLLEDKILTATDPQLLALAKVKIPDGMKRAVNELNEQITGPQTVSQLKPASEYEKT